MLRLPSVVDFEKDKSLRQRRFIQSQSEVNGIIKTAHQNNVYFNQAHDVLGLSTFNLPQSPKSKFKDNILDSHTQSRMLQQQMKIQKLQSDYGMQRSRIQDQNNAITYRNKYPYGKENVKITQDVLQKYSINNYQNQSDMLKRFQQQAKKRKQELKSSRRLQSNVKFVQMQSSHNDKFNQRLIRKKKTSILTHQKKKLQDTKRKYQKPDNFQKQNKIYQNNLIKQQQNKRLDNIEYLLKDMRQKMQQNVSAITQRQHQRQKQLKFTRSEDMTKYKLQNLSFIDQQEQLYRQKIPVVVYNKQKYNNYFTKHLVVDVKSYQIKQNIQKPQQYGEVMKIYNLNKWRLDKLAERISIKGNKSNLVV